MTDAYCTTSWLNHVLCIEDIQNRLGSISINDKFPRSEHCQLSIAINVHLQSTPFISSVLLHSELKYVVKITQDLYSQFDVHIYSLVTCSTL